MCLVEVRVGDEDGGAEPADRQVEEARGHALAVAVAGVVGVVGAVVDEVETGGVAVAVKTLHIRVSGVVERESPGTAE